MSQMILMFNHHCNGLGFLAGDFNCIMNASLDKSSSANTSKPRSSDVLKNVCADTGLIDIWWHLSKRLPILFIPPQFIFQTGLFLYSEKNFLYSVQTCSMDSIVLSDHAPVHLYINPLFRIPKTTIWRFNTSYFNSDSFFYLCPEQPITILGW